jgi:hypothetical protein
MGNQVDKNSREYLERQFNGGRHSLLILIIFTVVNTVMMLAESGTYFVCSFTVPYYLCAFGIGFDMEAGGSAFITTAVIISAVILAVYLVIWLMSKKKPGWLYAAFALFIIDTVALVLLSVLLEMMAANIIDLVIHAWVIWELFQGARCGNKLKQLPPDAPITGAAYAGTTTGADYLGSTSTTSTGYTGTTPDLD